jgi:hypothetical protein
MNFCGEIQYASENGYVHSDICFDCQGEQNIELTDDYREFLHKCLNEWLDNSNGNGYFWVGNSEHLFGKDSI